MKRSPLRLLFIFHIAVFGLCIQVDSWPSNRTPQPITATTVPSSDHRNAIVPQTTLLPSDKNDSLSVSTDETSDRIQRQLRKASRLAMANILLNLLRPDTWVPFAVRLPRALWEMAIVTTCYGAARQSPSGLLLLAIMMLPTALIDMFIGAPAAALFVSWETCTGGGFPFASRRPRVCQPDLVKGYGRLLVTLQCAWTGIVYLETAMVAWDAYQRQQRAETVRLQQEAMQQVAVTLKEELTKITNEHLSCGWNQSRAQECKLTTRMSRVIVVSSFLMKTS